MSKTWTGWHFCRADRKLDYGDGRQIRTGRTMMAKYERTGFTYPVMCHAGMHASRNPVDALGYAPGTVCCRVELHGRMQHGTDKAVADYRTVLHMADATETLRAFGLWCLNRAEKMRGSLFYRRNRLKRARGECLVPFEVRCAAAAALGAARCLGGPALRAAERRAQARKLTSMLNALLAKRSRGARP